MRRWLFLFLLPSLAVAQTPQTPRQALLELLKATSAEQIDWHTPDVLLHEMAKLPADVRQKQHQSMMFLALFMAMSPNTVQTFDSGPIFAVVQNPKDNSKVEVTVDRDDLTGDTDVMEFSIHVTKDGKPQELPFDPRLLIDMKLEKNVWKLGRIGASASIQLDDPKVAALIVQGIQEQLKKSAAASTMNGPAAPRTTSELTVVSSLRTLNTSEVAYAATYPNLGFTCRLSDLGGSLSGKSPDEHGAQLINPALEAGTRYGYRIEISACGGTPAHTYKIVATPSQKGLGHRTYCTDQSAVIRSVDEAASAECSTQGKPVN
jgi:hypothetical protein